jgi:predicted amidophosphoribosyltransferase
MKTIYNMCPMCTNVDDNTLPLCSDCNKEMLKWRGACSEVGIELTPEEAKNIILSVYILEEAGFDRKMAILAMLDAHIIRDQ